MGTDFEVAFSPPSSPSRRGSRADTSNVVLPIDRPGGGRSRSVTRSSDLPRPRRDFGNTTIVMRRGQPLLEGGDKTQRSVPIFQTRPLPNILAVDSISVPTL